MGLKIYLKGQFCGLYGPGDVIHAVKTIEPYVKAGEFYRISEIVPVLGSCGRNCEVVLEGTDGTYPRNAFRVDEECLKRMRMQSNEAFKLYSPTYLAK